MKTIFSFLLFLTLGVAPGQSTDVTNCVNMTTNLNFYLTAFKTAGAESTFKSDDLIYWGLLGTSTNFVYYRHFPSGKFDFHLFDESGKEILKSKAGKELSAEPPKPSDHDLFSTRRFFGTFVDNKGGEYRKLFKPDEIFMITNKGVYDLQVRMRLCVIMSNGAPDLSAMIDARNVNGHGAPYLKDFGILTSPPLRVKVIKE